MIALLILLIVLTLAFCALILHEDRMLNAVMLALESYETREQES